MNETKEVSWNMRNCWIIIIYEVGSDEVIMCTINVLKQYTSTNFKIKLICILISHTNFSIS